MGVVRIEREGLELIADFSDPAGADAPDRSSPTFLLLHAGAEQRGVWQPITPVLNDAGWRTIAPDLRGHGESGRVPEYRLDDMLDDALAFIDRFASRPLVLGGGSIGAAISLILIGEGRVQADGLVLLDLPTRPTMHAAQGEHSRIVSAHERKSAALAHVDPALVRSTFVADVMADAGRWRESALKLRVPTLVVRGLHGVISDEAVGFIREDIPHAAIAELDAGHLIARDQPEALAEQLVTFLAGVPRR